MLCQLETLNVDMEEQTGLAILSAMGAIIEWHWFDRVSPGPILTRHAAGWQSDVVAVFEKVQRC
jgi:hypothetical protein